MGLLTEEEAQQEQTARKIMREAVLKGIGAENEEEITALEARKTDGNGLGKHL